MNLTEVVLVGVEPYVPEGLEPSCSTTELQHRVPLCEGLVVMRLASLPPLEAWVPLECGDTLTCFVHGGHFTPTLGAQGANCSRASWPPGPVR